MADREHLEIALKGTVAIRLWRDAHPGMPMDLSGGDLTRAQLSRADLTRADLVGAQLRGARLTGANLRGARLNRAHLVGADLTGADLFGADLLDADLNGALLTDAILTHADLSRADLGGADLGGARLTGAFLVDAHLGGANLGGAHLTSAQMIGADLRSARLHAADLRDADLRNAHLGGAYLDGANVAGVCCSSTIFGSTDLSNVVNLDSVIHEGPSTIGVDTLFQSGGKIPRAFLQGAGVPNILIDYLGSLTGAAFEFYSCFISYSSIDDAFAQRLYADLQTNGVRCWFAPEDLKIGQKIRAGIDEAIRLHDKLLLVLSEQSILSEWVEKEVESAFDRERREKRVVLFPIRLDDAVMARDVGWPADIRRTRHIGDFRGWKDHDSYRTAFDRLLRDLKAAR